MRRMLPRDILKALVFGSLVAGGALAACGGDESAAPVGPGLEADGDVPDGTVADGTTGSDGAIIETDAGPNDDAASDGGGDATLTDADASDAPADVIVDAGGDACDGGRCPVPCGSGTCSPGSCCVGTTCVQSGKDCANGQTCRDGTCTGCGGSGQPCCANNTCAAGGCCGTDNKCVGADAGCGYS